jgi:hypothetical protein
LCEKKAEEGVLGDFHVEGERGEGGGVQIGTHAKEEEGIGIHVEREMGV